MDKHKKKAKNTENEINFDIIVNQSPYAPGDYVEIITILNDLGLTLKHQFSARLFEKIPDAFRKAKLVKNNQWFVILGEHLDGSKYNPSEIRERIKEFDNLISDLSSSIYLEFSQYLIKQIEPKLREKVKEFLNIEE